MVTKMRSIPAGLVRCPLSALLDEVARSAPLIVTKRRPVARCSWPSTDRRRATAPRSILWKATVSSIFETHGKPTGDRARHARLGLVGPRSREAEPPARSAIWPGGRDPRDQPLRGRRPSSRGGAFASTATPASIEDALEAPRTQVARTGASRSPPAPPRSAPRSTATRRIGSSRPRRWRTVRPRHKGRAPPRCPGAWATLW